jgi:uncharacterized protein (DUF1684 family)
MQLLLLFLLSAAWAFGQTGYDTGIERWRENYEAKLKADDGWLSVAGLFWLKDGVNRAGSASSADIVLPRGPENAGVFELHDGRVAFRAALDAAVTVNGAPTKTADLKADLEGKPDLLRIGDLTLYVIHRGDRFGIRLKDPASKFRREFTGLRWYPVKSQYRITAKFIANAPEVRIALPNILGETDKQPSPGYAVFELRGQPLRLDAVLDGDELFFIFRDTTSGRETYPAGRFLDAAMPQNGQVTLDFNQAYNPPCAFTPFATCPLPPPQNRLAVPIPAGELNYGHHAGAP